MLENADLPHVLAVINLTTAIALGAGFIAIRAKLKERHKKFMLSAILLGVLFLAIYMFYHANAGLAKFGGQGTVRTFYFSLLITHILAAVIALPLIPWTAIRAISGRYDAHKKMARWTLPLWLFVSASGVIIYVMAVHIYPFSG